jgi:beta-phosphoglucomutase-like phosphatase (HAD superfamily)
MRGLIFDMDGTMIDSMPYHARSWETFCRRHGLDMPLAEVLRLTTGRTGTEAVRVLLGEMDDARAETLVAQKEQDYRDLFSPVFREVAGFARFLDAALARGLSFGVGTAGDRHNVAFAMGHLNLATPPQVIVGGDEGLRGKPEPDIFLEAARRLGLPPEACVVFEDAPLGIEAARRAGMRAVAICTSHEAADLNGPHVIAQAPDYLTLLDNRFLENLHA